MGKRNFAVFASYIAVTALFASGIFEEGNPVIPAVQPAQFAPGIPLADEELDPNNSMVLDNTFAGIPRKTDGWDHGPTEYVAREGYVLEHSSRMKIPLWVSEGLTRDQLTGDAVRRDKFKADPQLNSLRADENDYRGTNFDRGHQAPAGNQQKVQRLKDETFYMSNMAPQQPGLNRYAWRRLEEAVRDWAEANLTEQQHLIVITGGMFYDPLEESRETADGWVGTFIIGDAGVAVPTHFYKIIIAPEPGGGPDEWQTIAFVLENRKYPGLSNFTPHIKSIDWIEARTGIDFMPELSISEENELESVIPPNWLQQ
jgi:endonuclease G, mitochondrial